MNPVLVPNLPQTPVCKVPALFLDPSKMNLTGAVVFLKKKLSPTIESLRHTGAEIPKLGAEYLFHEGRMGGRKGKWKRGRWVLHKRAHSLVVKIFQWLKDIWLKVMMYLFPINMVENGSWWALDHIGVQIWNVLYEANNTEYKGRGFVFEMKKNTLQLSCMLIKIAILGNFSMSGF